MADSEAFDMTVTEDNVVFSSDDTMVVVTELAVEVCTPLDGSHRTIIARVKTDANS
jgi:hypothetical protein